MRIISENKTTNKKPRRCNACGRVFAVGEKMKLVVCADDSSIWNWRQCLTCTELLDKFPHSFADDYGVCESLCVQEACNGELTPEQLLEKLKNETK